LIEKIALLDIECRLSAQDFSAQLRSAPLSSTVERLGQLLNCTLLLVPLEPNMRQGLNQQLAHFVNKLVPQSLVPTLLPRTHLASSQDIAPQLDDTPILVADAFTVLARCTLLFGLHLDRTKWRLLLQLCFGVSLVQAILSEAKCSNTMSKTASTCSASSTSTSTSTSASSTCSSSPLASASSGSSNCSPSSSTSASPIPIPEEAELAKFISLLVQQIAASSSIVTSSQQLSPTNILARCVQFLRRAALWHKLLATELLHLTDCVRSSRDELELHDSDVNALVHWLDLTSVIHMHHHDSAAATSPFRTLVSHWLRNDVDSISPRPTNVPRFLELPATLPSFSLVALPRLYQRLYQQMAKQHCVTCDAQPIDPAICLLCGQFLCCAPKHNTLAARPVCHT
jgi:hypothetical protein